MAYPAEREINTKVRTYQSNGFLVGLVVLAACLLVMGPAWGRINGLPEEVAGLEHGRLCILADAGIIELDVEIARTAAERRRGLMEREALQEKAGMLFLYEAPQPRGHGFWMYRTLLPLDLAFLDAAGNILEIRTMEPCKSRDPRRCPIYQAEMAYQAALEVNANFFGKRGVGPGARVVWDRGDGTCARTGDLLPGP